MQSYALISQDQTHRKMACGDTTALPKVTLLDPQLTLSQPFQSVLLQEWMPLLTAQVGGVQKTQR